MISFFFSGLISAIIVNKGGIMLPDQAQKKALAAIEKLAKNIQELKIVFESASPDIAQESERQQQLKQNGRVLQKIRDQLGYSQSQFAKLLGVSVQSISRWERGETAPSPKRSLKFLRSSQEFTEMLVDIESNRAGVRRLYNDCFSALVRPPSLTEHIFDAVGIAQPDVASIVKQNTIRIEKAKEYLTRYKFFHLLDKSLTENYIRNYTLPELKPNQTAPVALLTQLIENQIKFINEYKNYQLGLCFQSLDYNFGIIEGVNNKNVGWIEVREHVGQPQGILYGMSVDEGPMVEELQKTFTKLWSNSETERDKILKWLRELKQSLSSKK
jgi:DNA-binding transcriptional regulator YiaG